MVKYYRDGVPIRESSERVKEGDAKRLLRLREGEIERGVPVTPKIGRLRFDEAIAGVVNDYRELAILKRAFVLAIQAGKLVTRPYIPMLAEDNVRKGFFEHTQFEAVRSHLPDALRPLITFAYITGWRILSEVLPLQWRHVDFKGGKVRLDLGTTKNRDGRVFPLTAELRALLEAQRELTRELERERGIICPWAFHREGRRIRDFRTVWTAACEKAGCPGRTPHDFRRTAVRNFEQKGISRSVAMKLTGHKTESVYRRYAIVSESDLAEAARRLDSVAGTISGTTGPKSGESS